MARRILGNWIDDKFDVTPFREILKVDDGFSIIEKINFPLKLLALIKSTRLFEILEIAFIDNVESFLVASSESGKSFGSLYQDKNKARVELV
jgi:hypothetical protein